MFIHVLLPLPLALQPTVGFGLSNNTSPFSPVYHQLSPSSHSQHLKISFCFFSPSFRGSSSSFRPFKFLSEDLLGILSSSILSRWPSQLILCPSIHLFIYTFINILNRCLGTYWHILTLTDTFWHLLTHFDTHWHILTLTDTFWHLLTHFDTYWHIIDTYWHILTLTDTFFK